MTDLLVGILASLGALFVLLAAIGFVRMPDTYLRISVTTKAATLGIGLMMVATAIYFDDLSITTKVLAIILFLLLTAPVSAHLIGRASYFIGIELWGKSKIDELKGKYNRRTHELDTEENQNESKFED